MVGMYRRANFPPRCALDELLADPLIQLVMKADRVDPEQIRQLIAQLGPTRAPATAASPAQEGEMGIYPDAASQYRSGVGIMLLNPRNEVLVGRRVHGPGEAWQMPQGGIDGDEEPLAAALRELREEVGTDNVEVLAESRGWLRYDLPADLPDPRWAGCWRGQQQKWFAMRFLADDAEIDVATAEPEFSEWRWVPASQLPELIVAFKRQVYQAILQQFRDIHTASAQ